eukprot:15281158-Ditylum_brightwellii.AAC.1
MENMFNNLSQCQCCKVLHMTFPYLLLLLFDSLCKSGNWVYIHREDGTLDVSKKRSEQSKAAHGA